MRHFVKFVVSQWFMLWLRGVGALEYWSVGKLECSGIGGKCLQLGSYRARDSHGVSTLGTSK
jgi:hypothetical protein